MRQSPQHTPQRLDDRLARVRALLSRQDLVRQLVDKTEMPRHDLVQDLVARQQTSELAREINTLHPADAAYVLENLPLDERRLLWQLIDARHRGAVLLELADAVRDSLVSMMDAEEILGATQGLETDELADLMQDLPDDLLSKVMQRMDGAARDRLRTALTFPEGTVGALMSFDLLTIREDISLDVVLRYLRRRGDLPDGANSLYVVDRGGHLRGELPLRALLTHPGDTLVEDLLQAPAASFHTSDGADTAASAFERYDLIIAPVLNAHDQLVGQLQVDAVLDHIQATHQRGLLGQVGLTADEDLYAPVWKSARTRGVWLALNLLTAFIASRVIGQFEDTIQQIVALAALMPIVAAVGGNTGNQTLALMIRGYALGQIPDTSFRRLVLKEVGVGLLNGLIWGGAMAGVTWAIYGDPVMAAIMLAAMALTLTFAALAGALTPGLLHRLGQDPAYGSAIIVTGITDSLGFFIFLGLAALLLG